MLKLPEDVPLPIPEAPHDISKLRGKKGVKAKHSFPVSDLGETDMECPICLVEFIDEARLVQL